MRPMSTGQDAVAACNSPRPLRRRAPGRLVEEVERWKADDARRRTQDAADPAPARSALPPAAPQGLDAEEDDLQAGDVVDDVDRKRSSTGSSSSSRRTMSRSTAASPRRRRRRGAGRARARPVPPGERGGQALDLGRREAARVGRVATSSSRSARCRRSRSPTRGAGATCRRARGGRGVVRARGLAAPGRRACDLVGALAPRTSRASRSASDCSAKVTRAPRSRRG